MPDQRQNRNAGILRFPYRALDIYSNDKPIESMFATVRLRTNKIKNCGNLQTTLEMACKLMRTVEVNWCNLQGFKFLVDIIKGVKFRDGIHKTNVNHQDTVLEAVHKT